MCSTPPMGIRAGLISDPLKRWTSGFSELPLSLTAGSANVASRKPKRCTMLAGWRVRQVQRILQAGGVIAYPTEAVWGLGCNPWKPEAVERLLLLKQRPVEKGLILVAGSMEQFEFLLWDLPHSQLAKLQLSWPGPNTWLVPHQRRLPPWITGDHATVALRVSDHPQIRQMCAITGPLVSTSCNPAGRPPARKRLRVEQYFHGYLDDIVPGALGQQRNPSIIRDLQTDTVIRSA